VISVDTKKELVGEFKNASREWRPKGQPVRYWTHLATTSNRTLGPDNPHTLTTGSYLARAL
jgi:hypothetical protein